MSKSKKSRRNPEAKSQLKGKQNKKWYALLTITILATFFVFQKSLDAKFLEYDDGKSVSENIMTSRLSFESLPDYFKMSNLHMYAPINAISYALDYKIGGMNPYYFKLMNLLYHLLNIALVYFLFLHYELCLQSVYPGKCCSDLQLSQQCKRSFTLDLLSISTGIGGYSYSNYEA